jgi:3'-phosphoadenosine 5'-phosphosulfate sulfotransferase (PAPS reductase)/FAD synthetase
LLFFFLLQKLGLNSYKKNLPVGSFVVVFGDTGMEFPDTYDVINKTKQQCDEDGIPFYIAKSHLDPKESWELSFQMDLYLRSEFEAQHYVPC